MPNPFPICKDKMPGGGTISCMLELGHDTRHWWSMGGGLSHYWTVAG